MSIIQIKILSNIIRHEKNLRDFAVSKTLSLWTCLMGPSLINIEKKN